MQETDKTKKETDVSRKDTENMEVKIEKENLCIKGKTDVNTNETENMELEIGDAVLKEYPAGVLVCEIVGEHENWEKTYNIDVLFTSIGRDATKERNKSDKPLYANFPKYKSQKLEDLR